MLDKQTKGSFSLTLKRAELICTGWFTEITIDNKGIYCLH